MPGPDAQRDEFDSSDAPEGLESLLGEYIDRLNSGDEIDALEIVDRHPVLGPAIIRALETYAGRPFGGAAVRRDSLGDFELRREVGRGGMGVVYDAWQRSMQRRVALKVLPGGFLEDIRTVARFEREARIAADLRHPSLVPVYCLGVEDDVPHYAMEFVEGETLGSVLRLWRRGLDSGDTDASRLRRDFLLDLSSRRDVTTTKGAASHEQTANEKDAVSSESLRGAAPASDPGGRSVPVPESVDRDYCRCVAELFAGVAEALHEAHERGIVHRDVKPSNLMLDSAGRLRVLDFGLARDEGSVTLTRSRGVVGTPHYMSPEQARGRAVDRRTDVFSLGVTLYETLSLDLPFAGDEVEEVLRNLRGREASPLRQRNARVPRDLDTVVMKCLSRDPDSRYLTAEALAQDLRRFVRGAPVESRPPSRLGRAGRWVSHHRALTGWLGAAGLISLVLVWLTIALVSARREGAGREYDDAVLAGVKVRHFGHASSELPTGTVFHRQQRLQSDGWFESPSPVDQVEQDLLRRLDRATRSFPKRPEARYVLARFHVLRGREDEALAQLDRALASNPTFSPARALRADILGRSGRDEDAATDVAILLQNDPTWYAAWDRVRTARQNVDWDALDQGLGALRNLELERGESFSGSANDLLLQRGVARLEAGRPEGAIRDLAGVHVAWPELLAPVLLIGQLYADQGDLDAADDWFEEWFTSREGQVPFPEYSLGSIIEVFKNEVFQAGHVEIIRKWAERMPDTKLGSLRRIGALLHDDFKAALELAERAKDRWDDPVFLAKYAHVLCLNGRHDEARNLAGGLLPYAKESALVNLFVMAIYQTLGDVPMGESLCREQPRLGMWSAYFNLGYYLLIQGKSEEARAMLEARLDEYPADELAKAKLFHAYRNLGRFEDAAKVARALEDADLAFWQTEAYGCRALIHADFGRFEQAEAVYRECVERYPEARYSLVLYASFLFSRGRWDEAASMYVRSASVRPSAIHTGPRFFLGDFRRLSMILGFRPSRLSEVKARAFEEVLQARRSLYDDNWEYFNILAVVQAILAKHEDAARSIARAIELTDRVSNSATLAARSAVFSLRGDLLEAVHSLEARDREGRPQLLERLADLRRQAFPAVASMESVDAAFLTATGDSVAAMRRELRSGGRPHHPALESYVDGRALERSGDHDGALAAYRAALEHAPGAHEAAVSLAELLASMGRPEDGEQVLRVQITRASAQEPRWRRRALWNRWASFGLAELGWSASSLLDRMPEAALPGRDATLLEGDSGSDRPGSSPRDDLAWLFAALASDGPVRIDCGVSAARGGKALAEGWTHDRFARDGHARAASADTPMSEGAIPAHRTLRLFSDVHAVAEYSIPLPVGRYRITLHFAEVLSARPDLRRFDVIVESRRMLEGYAPGESGFARPDTRVFPDVEVVDGQLSIEFVRRNRSAIVSGIEIEPVRE